MAAGLAGRCSVTGAVGGTHPTPRARLGRGALSAGRMRAMGARPGGRRHPQHQPKATGDPAPLRRGRASPQPR